MKVYRTDEIRNVVLLGHGGSGKTSLVEAMLYVSGATSRMGKISEANTVSDFDKEEQKRGFSISTSLVPIEWEEAPTYQYAPVCADLYDTGLLRAYALSQANLRRSFVYLTLVSSYIIFAGSAGFIQNRIFLKKGLTILFF